MGDFSAQTGNDPDYVDLCGLQYISAPQQNIIVGRNKKTFDKYLFYTFYTTCC